LLTRERLGEVSDTSRRLEFFDIYVSYIGHDGCLKWLEPGGPEKKLEQTQYELAAYQDEVYPVKTAAALQNGYSYDSTKRAIYNDYGYWMFVSPHK
jgi:hypothetical protein